MELQLKFVRFYKGVVYARFGHSFLVGPQPQVSSALCAEIILERNHSVKS